MANTEPCGWLSDYPVFRNTPSETIVISLQKFLEETNPAQLSSWKSSVVVAQREVGLVLDEVECAREFSAVLEYELPREGGRRPDVVALQNGVVVVIEFKSRGFPLPEHLDQVEAYARDLKNYHELSHELEVVPVLVPTGYKGDAMRCGNVHVLPPNSLGQFLCEQAKRSTGKIIDAKAWVNSPYFPLPTLVNAARLLFRGQELPRIKRAQSARIPEVVDLMLSICHEAAATKTKHLIFLTGAPGSGKTLVGLQVAHSDKVEDLRVTVSGKRGGAPAVFLSGNGPLIEVLQDALGSRAFVDGMKKFIEYYGFKRRDLIPSEHVIIFDEAQRAWDEVHMETKHGQRISEPKALLGIAERIPEWGVVIALVGEGQEIHKGEEAGLANWRLAIDSLSSIHTWTIHGSRKLDELFRGSAARFETAELLNLSMTLRSHVATNLHSWVSSLLTADAAKIGALRTLAEKLREESFPIYATRDIEKLKAYARERYSGVNGARFGLVASRYAKNLRKLGVDNTYHFQRAEQLKVGRWFNAEPSDPLSSCSFKRPATEFDCQGLELDFPILCWGDDFLWNTSGWAADLTRRSRLNDPFKVTVNAYRVLLTRARDGMGIFVPESGDPRFDATYNLLIGAGAVTLK